MAPTAKYNLSDVFSLVQQKKVFFAARSRSVLAVTKVLELTETEAEDFILRGILTLTEAHFYQRVIQWDDPKCVADVYGLIFEGNPWYVKFMIGADGELDQISFHPPEKEFVTVGGIKIPKGATDVEQE